MKRTLPLLLALATLATFSARADVPAKIKLSPEGADIQCQLRWLPVDKVYLVTAKSPNGATSEQRKKPEDIYSFVVQPPKGWQNILAQLNKSPESVVPQLQAIAKEYKMLQYDCEAGRLLGTIYLKKGNPAQALKLMNEIKTGNAKACSDSRMAPVYWQAMVDAKQTNGLAGLLERGAQSTDRLVAGKACVLRGKFLMQENKPKDALKDGFLRAALLFGDQPEVQAEGLYEAALAFDKMNQSTQAEKMRAQLLSKYRNSPFAAKLNGR